MIYPADFLYDDTTHGPVVILILSRLGYSEPISPSLPTPISAKSIIGNPPTLLLRGNIRVDKVRNFFS